MENFNLAKVRERNAEYKQEVTKKLEETRELQALEEYLNSGITRFLQEKKYGWFGRKRLFIATFRIDDTPNHNTPNRETALILHNIGALDHFLERYRAQGWMVDCWFCPGNGAVQLETTAYRFYRIEKASKNKTAVEKQNEETNSMLQRSACSGTSSAASK